MRANWFFRFFISLFVVHSFLTAVIYSQLNGGDKSITKEEKVELINLVCERLDKVYIYPGKVSEIREYLNQ